VREAGDPPLQFRGDQAKSAYIWGEAYPEYQLVQGQETVYSFIHSYGEKMATYLPSTALKLLHIIIACPVSGSDDGSNRNDPHEGVTRV
jgi:hypothetical protein